MPSDQSQGDSGGSSVSISGSSRRELSALCGSAVNRGAKRLTAETQRTLSWRREFRIKTLLGYARLRRAAFPATVKEVNGRRRRAYPITNLCSLAPSCVKNSGHH